MSGRVLRSHTVGTAVSPDAHEPGPAAASPVRLATPGAAAPKFGEDRCAICLCAMDADAPSLACGHQFHAICLIPWLQGGHRSCPTCRHKPRITSADYGDHSDEYSSDGNASEDLHDEYDERFAAFMREMRAKKEEDETSKRKAVSRALAKSNKPAPAKGARRAHKAVVAAAGRYRKATTEVSALKRSRDAKVAERNRAQAKADQQIRRLNLEEGRELKEIHKAYRQKRFTETYKVGPLRTDALKACRALERAETKKEKAGVGLAGLAGYVHTPSPLERFCCDRHAFEGSVDDAFRARHNIGPPGPIGSGFTDEHLVQTGVRIDVDRDLDEDGYSSEGGYDAYW